MQHFVLISAFLVAVASARDFTLYSNSNFGGNTWRETRWDDKACWTMNGKGDQASSVRGAGCTTFYNQPNCQGSSWRNFGDAATIPGFLNDNIKSFRNQCPCPNYASPCQEETDGQCEFGYSACLQKMGCGGAAGGADCSVLGCTACSNERPY